MGSMSPRTSTTVLDVLVPDVMAVGEGDSEHPWCVKFEWCKYTYTNQLLEGA